MQMTQGSALTNDFHLPFAAAGKSTQKAQITLQPLRKSILESICEHFPNKLLVLAMGRGRAWQPL